MNTSSSRARICFLVIAVLVVVGSASVGLASQDPELRTCKHQCRAQRESDEGKVLSCIQDCEDYDRRKHGSDDNDRSPIEKLRECNRGCEDQPQRREDCQRKCQDRYEKDVQRYEERERQYGSRSQDQERESGSSSRREREREGEREREREREGRTSKKKNPYVFEERHFVTGMQTQQGRVRILQKFTEQSELLRGIENFRVAILEAQPQTFIVPNHLDAEILVFVAKGKGSVSMVREERRESFSIKEGDIFRIRAGTTTYLVNKGSSERLVLVKLLQPVNIPGEFQEFFGAGGDNPESYLKAFSNQILQAAFNVKGERIRRLFGQQKQGGIMKGSAEQIRSMSQQQEGGIWPFGGESKGTHNLFDSRPLYNNDFGQYYEVDSTHFRQLRDLDVAISLSNISQGAMTAPFYDSKATKIAIVVEGEGYFEMVCPHLAQSQSQEHYYSYKPHRETTKSGGYGYETVRSPLRTGTVLVVPAGHPMVAVASKEQNLQILWFKVNAQNNEQFRLAGKKNVMKQLEREAKELAFGVPAREVEEVFSSQTEDFFFEGPDRKADA